MAEYFAVSGFSVSCNCYDARFPLPSPPYFLVVAGEAGAASVEGVYGELKAPAEKRRRGGVGGRWEPLFAVARERQ